MANAHHQYENPENQDIQVNIYRPGVTANDYIYTEEYIVENNLEYVGALSTNTENLQINNQGGLIGFSVVSNNIGEYVFSVNEKIPGDGKIFKLAGIQENDIKFKISFDMIIETSKGNKFKSRISLDLPTGNIIEEGVGTLEATSLEKVIFKRIKAND